MPSCGAVQVRLITDLFAVRCSFILQICPSFATTRILVVFCLLVPSQMPAGVSRCGAGSQNWRPRFVMRSCCVHAIVVPGLTDDNPQGRRRFPAASRAVVVLRILSPGLLRGSPHRRRIFILFSLACSQVLIPGLQRDYPHRRLELEVAATAPPNVTFVADRGAFVEGAYETVVRVLPEDDQKLPLAEDDRAKTLRSGVRSDGAITVARLATNVSLIGDVAADATKISRLGVSYAVVESGGYAIDACAWERTIEFLLGEVQARWGLRQLWQFFVTTDVESRLRPRRVASRWRSWGWWEVGLDVELDL